MPCRVILMNTSNFKLKVPVLSKKNSESPPAGGDSEWGCESDRSPLPRQGRCARSLRLWAAPCQCPSTDRPQALNGRLASSKHTGKGALGLGRGINAAHSLRPWRALSLSTSRQSRAAHRPDRHSPPPDTTPARVSAFSAGPAGRGAHNTGMVVRTWRCAQRGHSESEQQLPFSLL